MNRVWRVAAHDVARVREMSAKLRVSPFLAQVILARGAATPVGSLTVADHALARSDNRSGAGP